VSPDVADAIDAEETIEVLRDLVRIESPYFEEAEAVTFVYE
jgi:succinyl-diaminopimelate desuccinylase